MSGSEPRDRIEAWIRLRGTPDDPESWDLGAWTGIVWEVRRELPNGRRVTLEIRDYLVAERLSPEIDPKSLYRGEPRKEGR